MFNLRVETIKSIIKELKITDTPFNAEIVKEFMSHIPDVDLKAFYMALFKVGAKEFNGLDRVSKIAETFKPVGIDLAEIKAKNLISLIETTNTQLGEQAKAKGEDFVRLVKNGIRLTLPDEDIAILNAVKPYLDHKELIINIRRYQTSSDSLRAFMNAIKYVSKNPQVLIECSNSKKSGFRLEYTNQRFGNSI